MKQFKTLLLAGAVMCCSLASLTSCSDKIDNPATPEPTPAEQIKADIYKQIAGTRVDTCMAQPLGYIRAYNVHEDNTFQTILFAQSDADGTGYMEAGEYNSYYITGKWEPMASAYCDEAGENFPALAVKCKIELYENAYGEMFEEEGQEWNDTIYIVPSDAEGSIFVWASDLDQLKAMQQGQAVTRNIFTDIWSGIKKAGQTIIKGAATAVDAVGQGIKAGFNAVKTAVKESVQFVGKLVARKYPVKISGNSDWMGTIYKDKNPLLRQMSIPGTHDAFTYDFGSLTGNWASTQVYNVEEQFDAGIRYFDMRFKGSGANLTGAVWKGLWLSHMLVTNISAQSAFEKIIKLLKAHPGETVICELAFDGTDTQELVNRLNEAVKGVSSYFVPLKDLSGDIRLNDCRGKIVIIQRFDPTKFTNADIGLYLGSTDMAQNKVMSMQVNGKTWQTMVQNFYECDLTKTLGYEEFEKKRKEYIDTKSKLIRNNLEDAGKDGTRWHFNFTSGYFKFNATLAPGLQLVTPNSPGGLPILDYPSNAHFMNKVALDYINQHMGEKTGIVAMDFGGLDKEGALSPTEVYGDMLVTALIENNKQLIEKKAIDLK